MKVDVGVSARHVHLSSNDMKLLFGHDILTKKVDLSQPGQFASNEQVTIKGEKGEISNVRILGPLRSESQVEISKTDCFKLGVSAPVRNSGDLKDAALITIIGPNGSITRPSAIIAARHIHMTKEDAIRLNVLDKKYVSIKVEGEKPGILENVFVRINDNFKLEVHLDTDDANAFLIKNKDSVDLIIK